MSVWPSTWRPGPHQSLIGFDWQRRKSYYYLPLTLRVSLSSPPQSAVDGNNIHFVISETLTANFNWQTLTINISLREAEWYFFCQILSFRVKTRWISLISLQLEVVGVFWIITNCEIILYIIGTCILIPIYYLLQIASYTCYSALLRYICYCRFMLLSSTPFYLVCLWTISMYCLHMWFRF